MTHEALKKMYQLLLTEPHAPTVCAQLEAIAREALAQPEQEPVAEKAIAEWAARHDIQGLPTDLRCMFEDAASLCTPPAQPAPAAPVQPEPEPVAWPCHIIEADFSERTITLGMECDDYKVSAGTHWLSTTPSQRTEQCLGFDVVIDPSMPANTMKFVEPPQRKPLTDEQIFACENSVPDEVVSDRDWCIHFARAIEAKLKENT